MYQTYTGPLIAAALIVASIAAYILFALPDRRSMTEKVGDAAKDNGDKIKKNANLE